MSSSDFPGSSTQGEKPPNPNNLVRLNDNTVASVGMSATGGEAIEPEDVRNPWLKEAYSAAIEFYENDKNLTKTDRQELSASFLGIARAQLYTGWSFFTIVFGTPFAVKYYKTKSVKGIPVPRNFIMGIAAMIFGTITGGKIAYTSAIDNLKNSTYEENIGDKSFRQYQILKLISPGESPKWAIYYKNTSLNPQRAVQDPRTLLHKVQNKLDQRGGQPPVSPFITQRDPLNLYSGPEFDQYKQDQKHNDYPSSLPSADSAHKPGFSDATFIGQPSQSDDSSLLNVKLDKPSSNIPKPHFDESDPDKDDPFFQENADSKTEGSAWDKIRRGRNP
ncbi:hypothetical protein ACO0QE_004317 [Hanseniaspora vineae]